MSHFFVLVIGPNVDAQLQPYHEYECTDIRDEYVVDVDVTDKALEEFNKRKAVVRLSDGTVKSRWDEMFYTIAPKYRLGNKQFGLPTGAVELEMSADEARQHGIGYASLEAVAADFFGGFIRDGRCYHTTNPNKKWDWWVIGGRWTGTLLLKSKALGVVGRPGLMTEPAAPGYADQAKAGDIDWQQMRNDKEVKARKLWRMTREITGGLSWESWDDTKLRYPEIETARREYGDQPALVALKASGNSEYSWNIDDNLALDEDTYIQRERDSACSFYAFVRDSVWTERGRIGWFGVSFDEVSRVQWDSMFNQMLDSLDPDTLVTVVDCHI